MMSTPAVELEQLTAKFSELKAALAPDAQKLAKMMFERGGLPDFQLVLNPDLVPLQEVLDQILPLEHQRRSA